MISVSACSADLAPIECSWVKAIYLAPQDQVTRSTENEIIAHNQKVERFCRGID